MLVTAGFSVSVRLARIAKRTACVSKVAPIVSQNRLFFHRERRLGTAIPNRTIGNIRDCKSLNRVSHLIPVLASPAMVASTRTQIRMYSARSFNRLRTSSLALWRPVTLAFYVFPESRVLGKFVWPPVRRVEVAQNPVFVRDV